MATSGSISKSGSWATVTLSWTRTSVDVANNRSTISYTLSLSSTYSIGSSASKSYSIVFNGVTVASGTNTVGGSGTRTLKTGTVVIPHNADGTKTFSYSFSQQMDVTLSGTWVGTLSASGSSTLDSIARASQPSGSDADNWYWYGQAITISTNRASSSFTHTLRYSWNGNTGTIATGVTTSYTWTIPESFMNYIPNDTYTSGVIYCDTYNGGTKIGTKSMTIYTTMPSSIVPSFTSISHSENVSDVATKIGGYVQGMSKLNLSIVGAKGIYNSTITSQKLTVDGYTYNSGGVSNIIQGSGTLKITATVTDSRGRTYSDSVDITVMAYSPPTITSLTTGRSTSSGANDEVGTYVKVVRSATARSLMVGTTEKNVLKYTIKTKERTASLWTTKVSLTTNSGLSLTGQNILSTFDVTKSYDIRLEVSDQFNTTIALGTISTGQVTMSWGRTGIGIGKVWEKGTLDVRGDTHIQGNLELTNGATYFKFEPIGSSYVEIETNSALIDFMSPVRFYSGDVNFRNDIVMASSKGIVSEYNNAHILREHGNGNVTLSASGRQLFLGYSNTTEIVASTQFKALAEGQISGFANGWSPYSSGESGFTPRYTKTVDGMVILQGLITGGSMSTGNGLTGFQLPVGCRPTATILAYVMGYGGRRHRLNILASGSVNIIQEGDSYSSWISLNGVAFQALQ
jgi:hypothetical protein